MKTKELLKWPLILAAIAVILRVILEQAGAPGIIANLSSVVMLYLVICPLYFAYNIAKSDVSRPYREQLKITALYATLARAMVVPMYWLAYIYQWQAPRFSVAQGGNVGPDVTPIWGFVLIPVGALIAWVIGSLIVGGGLGSVLIKVKRKPMAASA